MNDYQNVSQSETFISNQSVYSDPILAESRTASQKPSRSPQRKLQSNDDSIQQDSRYMNDYQNISQSESFISNQSVYSDPNLAESRPASQKPSRSPPRKLHSNDDSIQQDSRYMNDYQNVSQSETFISNQSVYSDPNLAESRTASQKPLRSPPRKLQSNDDSIQQDSRYMNDYQNVSQNETLIDNQSVYSGPNLADSRTASRKRSRSPEEKSPRNEDSTQTGSPKQSCSQSIDSASINKSVTLCQISNGWMSKGVQVNGQGSNVQTPQTTNDIQTEHVITSNDTQTILLSNTEQLASLLDKETNCHEGSHDMANERVNSFDESTTAVNITEFSVTGSRSN